MTSPESLEPFLASSFPLSGAHAVAALIVLDDGRYLMQLRDNLPYIWYPGHWGLFGGAVEPGEDKETALRRELSEEIDYVPNRVTVFTAFTFDFTFCGQGVLDRTFYEVPVSASILDRLTLGEGREMRAFPPQEILGRLRVTPYDAFALWLHSNRKRLRLPAPV